MSAQVTKQAGFTMIELLVAMTVFSFMLMIITMGFMNVVRMHNAAVASNVVQDNARTAIDELVKAVRDSSGVASIVNNSPSAGLDVLCLAKSSGPQQVYYVNAGVLYQADNCPAASRTNVRALTNSYVRVQFFHAVQRNSGANLLKPQVDVSVTVGSNNSTTTGSGTTTSCTNNNAARQFCSVVTLTSGAVPR
jgi:prepilin-type N-terminal cleavage/methylation domain-containing protein